MENNSQFKNSYLISAIGAAVVILVIISVIVSHRSAGTASSSLNNAGGTSTLPFTLATTTAMATTTATSSASAMSEKMAIEMAMGTTSSITSANDALLVVAPNGGEIWGVGSTETISWKIWERFLMYSPFDVFMVPQPNSCTSLAACKASAIHIAEKVNGLSFTWQIPNFPNIALGKYKADVCFSGTDVCDMSDNYFTIAAAASRN